MLRRSLALVPTIHSLLHARSFIGSAGVTLGRCPVRNDDEYAGVRFASSEKKERTNLKPTVRRKPRKKAEPADVMCVPAFSLPEPLSNGSASQYSVSLLAFRRTTDATSSSPGEPASTAPPGLPPCSDEQTAILNAVREGDNVLVDAVAGSGKTTTILHLARAFPGRRVLALTYNAQLKVDMRAKAKAHSLPNLEVHSYHAFAVRHYGPECSTDAGLTAVLREEKSMRFRPKVDLLVLDELQDMTPLYYRLVHRSMQRAGLTPQMVLLGDRHQSVFDFKGADARYLTLGTHAFPSQGNQPRPWRSLSLRTSFRLTPPMAWFVNEALLGERRLVAHKRSGPSVQYLVGDHFRIARHLSELVQGWLRKGQLRAEDLFVLAPSMQRQQRGGSVSSPLKLLEHLLVEAGVPVYVPVSDEERVHAEVIAGKVAFSTFHQCKGMERRAVICFGFSADYFQFYARGRDVSQCPPPLYVAATRASERLYLVAETKAGYHLPFLHRHVLMGAPDNAHAGSRGAGLVKVAPFGSKELALVYGLSAPRSESTQAETESRFAATELVRFLPPDVLVAARSLLRARVVVPASTSLALPSLAGSKRGLVEQVSELNGLALVAMHEHRTTGKIAMQAKLRQEMAREGRARTQLDSQIEAAATTPPSTPADYLRLAALYQAALSGYHFKPSQLTEYNWLPDDLTAEYLRVLEHALPPANFVQQFERELWRSELFSEPARRLVWVSGALDLCTADAVWEVKCVQQVEAEHLLQLAIYGWLQEKSEEGTGPAKQKQKRERTDTGAASKKQGEGEEPEGGRDTHAHTQPATQLRLLNARTGEVWEVPMGPHVHEAVLLLVRHKLRQHDAASDEAFLRACEELRREPARKKEEET